MEELKDARVVGMLRDLERAYRMAGIPETCRGFFMNKFFSFVGGKNSMNPSVLKLIYKTPVIWESDFNFLIEGDRVTAHLTESGVRRATGMSILCNGIIHAVQENLPPYDAIGKYVDFQSLVTMVIDRSEGTEKLREFALYRYLFISEISMSADAPRNLNEYVRTRLNDLLRRRRDAGLVNILSFKLRCSVLCSQNMASADGSSEQNILGEEIFDLLQLAKSLPTTYDVATRICKIKLQNGDREKQDLAKLREIQAHGDEPGVRADKEPQASA